MSSKARTKLFPAELYLEDAEARLAVEDEVSPTIGLLHATDGIIMALDAICHSHNVNPPKRHDQAEVVFVGLIVRGLLPGDASTWRELLVLSSSQRTGFQYQGKLASLDDARRFIRKAKGFVAFARGQVRP